MKNKDIISFDNLVLRGYLFDDVVKPIGVVQIIHGMQEHAERYFDTIKEFNNRGYIVFVSDLRAHGKTARSIGKLGTDVDIFKNTVEDQLIISQTLKKDYPDLPLYVFGHSFGSFVAQRLMQVSDLSKKHILCGTSDCNNIAFKMGRIVAWFTGLKNGRHGDATLLENMSLKGYGKKFENGNWLSRDNSVMEKYLADPYCGTSFPVSFYKSLFKNGVKLNKGMKNIPLDTQILIIVGGDDPVSNNGKLARRLNKKYVNHCLRSNIIIYPSARHELLNETNKDEVLDDVFKYLEK